MTLDSLPDLDTSGLCLVKTLPTALTGWPYRNTALRDGARTSTRTSSVAKGRTASIHCRPAPPRQTEALSSRTSRSRPWKRRSQAVRRTRRPRARHSAVQARSGAGGKRFRTPTRIRSLPDQATEHLRRYRFARFTTAWIEPSRLWGTPYRKSATFSDSGAHAIHLKSSSSDLVADEKAFSDRARAGDAVRPAQLLRDRRHQIGRASCRERV